MIIYLNYLKYKFYVYDKISLIENLWIKLELNKIDYFSETDSNDSINLKKEKEVTDSQIENKSVLELLDVLTEIKDCKDSCMFEPNFHPCPWCSGKLITV